MGRTQNFTNSTREIFSNDLKVLRLFLYIIFSVMLFFGGIFYFFEIQEKDNSFISRIPVIALTIATLLFSYHPKFPFKYTRSLIILICYLLTTRVIFLAYNNHFEVAFFVALLVVIQIVTMVIRTSISLKYYLGISFLITSVALLLATGRPLEGKVAMVFLLVVFNSIQFYINNLILLNNQYQYEQREKIEVKNKELLLSAKQAEILNQQLIRKNKELDKFSYIASHDLKAPLRAINNLSEWIEEDMADLMPPDVQEQMTLLRSRVRRMERLINGLLEYSRVGRLELDTDTVHTGGLVAQVLQNLDYPETFSFGIADNMPTLTTKTNWLRKVFKHLIINAIQYHPKKNGTVNIGYKDGGAFHEFYVQDDGLGIKSEYHEKIFVIFQTLEARDRNDTNGVGLAIVKKYIEDEGGKVWIESTSGEGSTFWFSLLKQETVKAIS